MTPPLGAAAAAAGGLLQLLSPTKSNAAAAGRAGGEGGSEFADLLQRAAAGELISGREVSIDRDAGVSLGQDQLARLSLAADRAEAAGLHTALAMMDGMALVLDVKTRTILRQVDVSGEVLSGIDGIVPVPGGGQAAPEILPPPPGGVPANPSLLKLLAATEPRPQGSAPVQDAA